METEINAKKLLKTFLENIPFPTRKKIAPYCHLEIFDEDDLYFYFKIYIDEAIPTFTKYMEKSLLTAMSLSKFWVDSIEYDKKIVKEFTVSIESRISKQDDMNEN